MRNQSDDIDSQAGYAVAAFPIAALQFTAPKPTTPRNTGHRNNGCRVKKGRGTTFLRETRSVAALTPVGVLKSVRRLTWGTRVRREGPEAARSIRPRAHQSFPTTTSGSVRLQFQPNVPAPLIARVYLLWIQARVAPPRCDTNGNAP